MYSVSSNEINEDNIIQGLFWASAVRMVVCSLFFVFCCSLDVVFVIVVIVWCVTASHYSALIIPHSPGAVRDLARSTELGNIVSHFVEENSK